MDTEIELKLFLSPTSKQPLIALLNGMPHGESKPTKQLENCYYDTPDLQLRQWQMGMRVRIAGKKIEQTIKTSGRVIGGIHSRPEYNVDIDTVAPNLALFPAEIWPKNADLPQLQSQLTPLFQTDFERLSWHVYYEESLIEVALDIGTISVPSIGEAMNQGGENTGVDSEAICELEFELLAGEASALVKLAAKVAETIPVRLAKASKAQRGYRLAAQSSSLNLEALDFIALPANLNLNTMLVTLLETGLERWQLLEEMIAHSLNSPAKSAELWYRLRACVRLLRLTLKQYKIETTEIEAHFSQVEERLSFIETTLSLSYVVLNKKSLMGKLPQANQLYLQAKIHLHEQKLPDHLHRLWQMPSYGQLQLALVDLMLSATKQELAPQTNESLRQFSDRLQEASWQRIVTIMPSQASLSTHDYQQFAKALDESILVGFAYGQLYSQKERDQFRGPWQDLVLGIRTLSSYQQLAKLSADCGLDIGQWLEDKSHSLLLAMEHSRKSALAKEPYWR